MECSICLDVFEQIPQTENSSLLKEKKYKNAHELSCGHMFHKKCINNWLKNNSNCPYCRKYFKTNFSAFFLVLVTIPDNFTFLILEKTFKCSSAILPAPTKQILII